MTLFLCLFLLFQSNRRPETATIPPPTGRPVTATTQSNETPKYTVRGGSSTPQATSKTQQPEPLKTPWYQPIRPSRQMFEPPAWWDRYYPLALLWGLFFVITIPLVLLLCGPIFLASWGYVKALLGVDFSWKSAAIPGLILFMAILYFLTQ